MSDDETAPVRDLSTILADAARAMLAPNSIEGVLNRVSQLAVEIIDGAQHCAVTVVEGRTVRTAAATGVVPRAVDQIQYDTSEGPCLDAIRDHVIFQSDDIGTERRWPAFSVRVRAETPVRSMLSFRLHHDTVTMGALNLYSEELGAFVEADRYVGSLFAAHAAVAMANEDRIGQLEAALASRDVIATAKGMLMEQSHVSDDEAFAMLRRASQRLNIKLRDVAQRIVDREPPPGS